MPHLTSTVTLSTWKSQASQSSSVLLRNLKMAYFIQPMAVLVTTLLALEATSNPVAQPVQPEGTNVGALISEYTTDVQYLHATVDYLRQILLQKLSTARISSVKPSCFTYPYKPSRPDTNRLRDDVETLRKLLPVATNAAQFEAGLNVSNASVEVLPLVNLTVSKLEDVVSDFTELGKALTPVYTAATEEEEGTEDKADAQSPASDQSCALVQDVLQEYEVILQLHIALTYTVRDAMKLNNYYNSPAA